MSAVGKAQPGAAKKIPTLEEVLATVRAASGSLSKSNAAWKSPLSSCAYWPVQVQAGPNRAHQLFLPTLALLKRRLPKIECGWIKTLQRHWRPAAGPRPKRS